MTYENIEYRSPVMEADLQQSAAAKANWLRMATQFIRANKRVLIQFTVEDLAALWYKRDMPAPQDTRNWGLVIQRAKREGIIRPFTIHGDVVTDLTRAGHRTTVWTTLCRS